MGGGAGGGPLGRVLGMARLEGGRMRLGALKVRHPLLSDAALVQLVTRHYTRAALPQLFKLLASADVFGIYLSLGTPHSNHLNPQGLRCSTTESAVCPALSFCLAQVYDLA